MQIAEEQSSTSPRPAGVQRQLNPGGAPIEGVLVSADVTSDRFRAAPPEFQTMALGLHASPKVPKAMIRETREVVDLARRFNEQVARPWSLDLERKSFADHDYLPWDLVDKCNQWGLYTAFIPKVFGGKGYNLSSFAYFNEEVGSVCLGIANIISVHMLGVACLTVSGKPVWRAPSSKTSSTARRPARPA